MPRPLWMDGKRVSQSPVTAMMAGLKDCLLYISDNRSGRRFVVATGAEVSVVPATGLNTRTLSPSTPLLAANDSCIRTCGKHTSPSSQ